MRMSTEAGTGTPMRTKIRSKCKAFNLKLVCIYQLPKLLLTALLALSGLVLQCVRVPVSGVSVLTVVVSAATAMAVAVAMAMALAVKEASLCALKLSHLFGVGASLCRC